MWALGIPLGTKIYVKEHYEFKIQNKLDILRKISGNEYIDYNLAYIILPTFNIEI